MSRREKTIAFVLYGGMTPLDIVGPLQVMSMLRIIAPEWRTTVVGETLEPVPTDAGLSMAAERTFAEVSHPTIIVVPGGDAPTVRQMGNPVLQEYLVSVSERAEIVASVCTGSLILAAAGLLEGRKATTHWGYHMLLERLGATYLPQRWVEDGKYMTSAGVSAGIDLALALVSRVTDETTSKLVQLGIEYDPEPPFGGIAWDTVDRDMLLPIVMRHVQVELSDRPELQARLLHRPHTDAR